MTHPLRILVLQHADVEHPGTFREVWAEAGHTWVAVELDRGEPIPEPDGFDLMVVMGGPMDVWQVEAHPWLLAEKAAIRHWVAELGRPYLGICLGHQLLADALGGRVGLMARPEVGLGTVATTPAGRADPVLAGLPDPLPVFQWHGAEVAVAPEGGEVLTTNATCAVQSLRWRRHAYGFQHHCEIGPDTVSDWERIPEYRESLERTLGAGAAEGLTAAVTPRLPDFRAMAGRLNANLMALVGQRT